MECYKLNYADLRKENLAGKEWINIYNPKIFGSELDFAKIAPNVKKLNLLDTRFDLRGKISVPSTTELCLGGMGLQDTYISSTELKNGILHMYLSRRR